MTLRFKLTMGFLAALVVANSVLCVIAVHYLSDLWLHEVQTRVRLDLNAARAAYLGRLDVMSDYLSGASLDPRWVRAMSAGDRATLRELLENVHKQGGMDFVDVVGPDGRVICRAGGDTHGDAPENPLVARVLQSGHAAKGTVVVPKDVLRREGQPLAERARSKLVPTPAAKPTSEVERGDGMVLAACVPLRSPQGNLSGALLAGNLLNGRNEIVDAIRDEVFPGAGTVTIFQQDARIATNVLREDGSRAVGTRMSAVVQDAVLERGEVWADRAFVVRDWYITAYEPLRDPTGRIIGALYVGLPEAPFVQKKHVIIAVVLASAGGATLLSLLLMFGVTQLVLRPVGRIVDMSRRVIAGDLSARVGIRPPGEMGLLCKAIDAMGEAVAERERQLKETTSRQIGRSEQLAAIGRLASGVAHEINNPLTAVLTFASLLRDKTAPGEQDRQDLDLIIHETTRAAEIVRGLLDFARERPVQRKPLDINEVIRQTMRLVRSHKQARDVQFVEDLAEGLPPAGGDRNQLQQVLINLSLNACEAMPEGGTLTVRSRHDEGRVVVEIADTGCGIKAEHVSRVFEPFFTTKPVGKGTGLGLSVSYGIVLQHNGTLEFESTEGKGTTFRISLPLVEETVAGSEAASEEQKAHE